MKKQLILINNPSQMINKETINKLVIEINKLNINKTMKKFLLIASINLLSSTKTTSGLVYQLTLFRKNGKIYPEKTRSKYMNSIIKDLKKLSISDYTNTINNLIDYLNSNKTIIKIN